MLIRLIGNLYSLWGCCYITGRITAEALKERVTKVLQVWADWFLFSDAYVNGLRATFLRSGNSGVTPFQSICGDAPEIEKKTSSEDTGEVGEVQLFLGNAGTAMRPLTAVVTAAVTAAGGNASYVLDGVPRILSPAYFHHYNARLMPADVGIINSSTLKGENKLGVSEEFEQKSGSVQEFGHDEIGSFHDTSASS